MPLLLPVFMGLAGAFCGIAFMTKPTSKNLKYQDALGGIEIKDYGLCNVAKISVHKGTPMEQRVYFLGALGQWYQLPSIENNKKNTS